ncbi:hypothetical protein D3C71_1900060 [compost metagenome]
MELALLKPELKGGRYFFGEKEIRDFQAIAQLKQWGFTLKEVQGLFDYKQRAGCGTAGVLIYAAGMLQERIKSIDSAIAELGRQRKEVVDNLAEVEQVLMQLEGYIPSDEQQASYTTAPQP